MMGGARIRPIMDRVVVTIGVVATVLGAVVIHHQATMDPYSVWCDPQVVACHTR